MQKYGEFQMKHDITATSSSLFRIEKLVWIPQRTRPPILLFELVTAHNFAWFIFPKTVSFENCLAISFHINAQTDLMRTYVHTWTYLLIRFANEPRN